MQINTVTIPIRDYLDLLEIKESQGVYLRGNYHTLYGSDKIEKELVRQITEANQHIGRLNEIIDEKNKKSFWKRFFK